MTLKYYFTILTCWPRRHDLGQNDPPIYNLCINSFRLVIVELLFLIYLILVQILLFQPPPLREHVQLALYLWTL